MRWALAVCVLLTWGWSTRADTEVKSLHITSDIKNRYATTHISSRVANAADEAAEASFYVTFPDTAFVTGFAIDVNDREIKAELKKNEDVKDLDKELGDDIIPRFVRDANKFNVVVKVEAKGEVTFKLTYEELLSRHMGVYSNNIHLDPQQIVDDLKVTVNIEEPTIITDLTVHKFHGFSNVLRPENEMKSELAKIEHKSPQSKHIVWAPTPDEQRAINAKGVQGELVVKYDLDRLENAQPYLMDEKNYFADFFAIDALPVLKKHIIFVIDYSYSMEGQKLEQFIKAMGKILPGLKPKDYFSIVLIKSFAEAWSPSTLYRTGPDTQDDADREHMLKSDHNLTDTLSPEFLVEASPANIELARKYLQEAELGGSFLVGALKAGLDLANIGANQWKDESDPPLPIILFLSDGIPTTGEVDEDAIIDQVKALNPNQVPIYSLAFGYYADYDFLRRISLSNYGVAKKIYVDEDAYAQMTKYYIYIASPLLTKLSFNYVPNKVGIGEVTKHKFPVYFKGSEVVVSGRVNEKVVTDNDTIGEITAVLGSAGGIHKHAITVGHKVPGNTAQRTSAYLLLRQFLDERDILSDGSKKSSYEVKIGNLALHRSFLTPASSLVIEKPDGSKSVVEFTPLKQAPPLDKTELKKITWLQQYLTDDTAAEVTVTLKDQSYNLALKPSEETFGKCASNLMAGECRHFQKCALEIFEDDVSEFIPFKCDITGNYLGVCCPFHVS